MFGQGILGPSAPRDRRAAAARHDGERADDEAAVQGLLGGGDAAPGGRLNGRAANRGDPAKPAVSGLEVEPGLGERGAAAAPQGATELQSYINVLKANVGPGCLSLPYAFSQAGTVLGPVGFSVLAAMALYNMHLLLDCQDRLKRQGVAAKTYGDVAQHTLGDSGRALVDLFVVITQVGICSIYLVFFADSFPVEAVNGGVRLEHWQLVLAATPLPLALAYISEVKHLTPYSLAANVALAVSLLFVLLLVANQLQAVGSAEGLPLAVAGTLPLFVGNVVFSLEGIGLVMPIANAARDRQRFPRVLTHGMLTSFAIFVSVGWLSYLAFGTISDGSITAELENRGLAGMELVNVLLCVAILLTYPLQLRPAAEVLSQTVNGTPPGNPGSFLFRSGIVVGTAGLAASVPNLGAIIGLCGSGGSAMLALIMPPLLELKQRRLFDEPTGPARAYGLGGVAAFGAAVALWGTVSAAAEIWVH